MPRRLANCRSIALFLLLAGLLAPPTLADCFQDAKNLYDSCVDFQFVLNGQLFQASEEACAEVSAAATNACLVAAGKADPGYAECRLSYDYFCMSPQYNRDAFERLEAQHYNQSICQNSYMLIRRSLTCG